jgi:hypothetical protein
MRRTRLIVGCLALGLSIATGCGATERPADQPTTAASGSPSTEVAPAPRQTTEEPGADDLDRMLRELDEDPSDGIQEVPGCLELRGENDCTAVGKIILVCTGLGNILTEQPTERLVRCLKRHDGTGALCETRVLEECALAAIDATAATASSRSACRQVLSRCDVTAEYARYFTEPRCASGLASLESTPRREFERCMARTCDLKLCASGLL